MSGETGLEEEVDGRTFFLFDGDTADEEYLVGSYPLAAAANSEPQHIEIILVSGEPGSGYFLELVAELWTRISSVVPSAPAQV